MKETSKGNDVSESDRLDYFINKIIDEANEKKNVILDELVQERGKQIEQFEDENLAEAYRLIQDGIVQVRREIDSDIYCLENKLRRRLFEERDCMFCTVMSDVEDELKKFLSTPDYALFINKQLTQAMAAVTSEDLEIFARADDLELFAGLDLKGAVLKDINKDIIGGFVVKDIKAGVVFDCTLKSQLELQREYFLEYSGLTIED